jgi:hypothetical protein
VATKWERSCNVKLVVSALKLSILILAVVVISRLAQTASGQNSQLPPQAKQVEGVVVPVPREIFRSLDEFRDANWRAVQRQEIARWKSRGDQVQIAILLGVEIAEGFIAMEAQDSTEAKSLGKTVLKLARGLGVEKRALRRSRSIMEYADKNEWLAGRKEWDGAFFDLQSGMIAIKSNELAQLVSLGGWLRGTEALSALVLQNYSPERAELIRQPLLLDHLEKQLLGMNPEIRARPRVAKMVKGIRRIRVLIQNENGPPTKKTVKEIEGICEQLVTLSSRRRA